MSQLARLLIVAALFGSGSILPGQTPGRPAAATPTAAPTASSAVPSPSASPPVATPGSAAVIDAMGSADLQQAIQLLKSNYINADALNETELNRAMLAGVLLRLGAGAQLLPGKPAEAPELASAAYGDILEDHIAYLRFGALTPENLQALDAKMQTFGGKKIDAAVIDLRASPGTNDFALAAEFAKRFCAKGKPLFTLRKAAGRQERPFVSDRDPAYQGLMIVLADRDTSGPAEAIAGALRIHNKALVIGQPTAGRAVEYSDLPLNHGRLLRVAIAEAVLPEGRALFPGGLKPDLPVEMSQADKRLVFQQSLEKGMAPFVFESERPHLNEAALIAGRNPEIEATEAAQRRGRNAERIPTRDPVVQRAVDVVTSLTVYQQR